MIPSRRERTPFDVLQTLSRDVDRVLGMGGLGEGLDVGSVAWPADVRENGDELVCTIEAPGMDSEDFDITVENNVLTIRGEKRFENTEGSEEDDYRLVERRYGRMQRSFMLPNNLDTDQVEATYNNGLLRITIPKSESAKPRKISVKGEGASGGREITS